MKMGLKLAWAYFPIHQKSTGAQNNIPTLLYSPWEKIDVKVHSKVRSTQSEVHKCVSIWYTIPKILIPGHK